MGGSSGVHSLPLVLLGATIDGELWGPSLEHEGLVVVVVEDTGIDWVTPESVESRGLWFGGSEGVGSLDGSGKSPAVLSSGEDVLDEDVLMVSTSIGSVSWALTFSARGRTCGLAFSFR